MALPPLSFSRLDLTPMDYYPDAHPALHLVVYSVNQKGRSEPIVLENVPINEADKRSGELMKSKNKRKRRITNQEPLAHTKFALRIVPGVCLTWRSECWWSLKVCNTAKSCHFSGVCT